MAEKSLKLNYVLNIVRIVLGMIFPLITFPYASRILMPEGIGRVAFANSFVAYFVILSQVGIPLYAVRECAKVRDDRDKLSKLTQELLIINFIAVIIAYFIFVLMLIFNERISGERELFILCSATIIFSTIGMEWLYQALEEYVYITVRSLMFQVAYVVLLLLLVKAKEDYLIYAFLILLSSVGSNIANFLHSRKFINYKMYKNYDLKRHIKPISILFLYSFAINIYSNLNTIMLGFMAGNVSVGLYSAATKISRIILNIMISLGSVLMPRISYYIQNSKNHELSSLIRKSVDFTVMLSLPAMAGLFMFSDEIILLFSGEEFFKASITMKIITPLIILVAFGSITGHQILMPIGKEKNILMATIAGAIVSLLVNVFVTSRLAQNGTAIATIAAELSVTGVQLFYSWNYLKDHLFTRSKLEFLVATLIIVIEILIIKSLAMSSLIKLLVSIAVSGFSYTATLLILRNNLIFSVIPSGLISKVKKIGV